MVTFGGKPALLFTGVTTVSGVSHTTVQPINQHMALETKDVARVLSEII